MDTIAIIFSSVALFGSIYTYIAHDRRLKKQDQIINNYQIVELEEKELAKKSANLGCTIYAIKGSVKALRVFNKGSSDAYDIKVEFPENIENVSFRDKNTYKKLAYQDKFDIRYLQYVEEDEIPINIHWTDELGAHSKEVFVIL